MLLQLHAKHHKRSMHWLLIIPEKHHFAPFLVQKLQSSYSVKIICIKLVFYATVTSWKKIKTVHALTFDNINNWKTALGSFWLKNIKTRFFPNILFRSMLRLCATVALCKGSEQFWVTIFHKTWKTSYWAHFGPFWPKNVKQDFHKKNH